MDPQSRSALFDLIEGLRDDGVAVLYTTHSMGEAERLCSRIGIIDHGKRIAEGTRAELVGSLGAEVRIEVGFEPAQNPAYAEPVALKVPGVSRALVLDERLHVFANDGAGIVPGLLRALLDASLGPASVRVVEPDLEQVFLHLTGRALRD